MIIKTFGLATFASLITLFTPSKVLSVDYWMGFSDPRYTEGCVVEETNLRTSPRFTNSNIRAILIEGSCGNFLLNEQGSLVYENGFYLLEFYFPAIDNTRRYWVHESRIYVN